MPAISLQVQDAGYKLPTSILATPTSPCLSFHETTIWSTKDMKTPINSNEIGPKTKDETTNLRGILKSTMKHDKKELYVCPEAQCGKHFPRSFALRRHMRIHTGMKPYECDQEGCHQRFNTSGNLSRHKRIHSGERPYPCLVQECGKRFNTSTKLKRHMRIHYPDATNVFRCIVPDCTFACDNYKDFVQHDKNHMTYHSMSARTNGSVAQDNVSSVIPSYHAMETMQQSSNTGYPPQPSPTLPPYISEAYRYAPPTQYTYSNMYHTTENHETQLQLQHHPQRPSVDPTASISTHSNTEYERISTPTFFGNLLAQLANNKKENGFSLTPTPKFATTSSRESTSIATNAGDRPRPPFPTGAFPSESLVRSPMNRLTPIASNTTFRPTYEVQYSTYSRTKESPNESSQRPHVQQIGHRTESERNGGKHIKSEGRGRAKYYDNHNGNQPSSEFTGEELSAVLELMKDS